MLLINTNICRNPGLNMTGRQFIEYNIAGNSAIEKQSAQFESSYDGQLLVTHIIL